MKLISFHDRGYLTRNGFTSNEIQTKHFCDTASTFSESAIIFTDILYAPPFPDAIKSPAIYIPLIAFGVSALKNWT